MTDKEVLAAIKERLNDKNCDSNVLQVREKYIQKIANSEKEELELWQVFILLKLSVDISLKFVKTLFDFEIFKNLEMQVDIENILPYKEEIDINALLNEAPCIQFFETIKYFIVEVYKDE